MTTRARRKTSAVRFGKRLAEHLATARPFSLDVTGTNSLAAWFLGPKAENENVLEELVRQAVQVHSNDRRQYFPQDPPYVTEEIRNSPAYKESLANLRAEFDKLLLQLKGSVPFFSYRYQAHMNWDLTLPSVAGYFAAMLYNQNNVAAEASPVTTPLEMAVGDDLCELLGYTVPPPDDTKAIRPWGHITCDGTVANIEGMWSSRNMKYYPVSLKAALLAEPSLAAAKNMTVRVTGGGREVLIQLDNWTLLNLDPDEILAIPTRMEEEYGISEDTLNVLNNYSLQQLGYDELNRRYLKDEILPPAVLGPATMHYSWPKAAALLGIGQQNVIDVPVDLYARTSVPALRSVLDQCLAERRPVIMNVVVLGSTEESAVDPLADILELRQEYRQAGLNYPIHVDAAWGGYFAALLREPKAAFQANLAATAGGDVQQFTPDLSMSAYVNRQYRVLGEADSITIDPHKAGYCPYPAGGLCYRNGSQRNLVSFTAPVVYHGGVDPTVGVYGVEGSKPGAAAAGVYLSHRVIRTNRTGYGKILGQSLFNSKRLYAALVTMAMEENAPFIVVPFQRLPAEAAGEPPAKVRAQLEYIAKNIVPKTNDELIADPEAMNLLKELGSDQIIISYAFNYRRKDGTINDDVDKVNTLNNNIYTLLSLSPQTDKVHETPLIVTSSQFEPSVYGQAFMDDFKRRLRVHGEPEQPINFLLSTTMDPWVTSTAEGNFIPTLIAALRKAVLEAIAQVEAASVVSAASDAEAARLPIKAKEAAAGDEQPGAGPTRNPQLLAGA